MAHDQIATDLGLPITTVYARFHKAKGDLRVLLEQEVAESLRGT
jgi:DNA-directed RNA polymerase specialized sigma24 family protein